MTEEGRDGSGFSYSRAVLAISAGNVGVLSGLYVAQPILPIFAAQFKISASVADLSISLATLALAAALLVLGPLSDRVGRRRVMLVASALLVLPTLGIAVAPTFPAVLALRVAQGACSAGVGSISLAYIIQEFPPRQVGSGVRWGTLSLIVAAIVGRVGGGLVTEVWGWRAAFLACAALELVGLVLMLLWLPPERRFVPSTAGTRALAGLLRHGADRTLLRVDAGGFLVSFTLLAYLAQLSFYLSRAPFRLGPNAIGLVYLVYVVGLFAPVAGRVSTRIGRRPTIAAGLLILLLGSALSLVHSLPVVILATALASLGLFVAHTSNTAYVGDHARHDRGAATALYLFAYYVGGSVGVYVLGLAWDVAGWNGVVTGCALACLTAIGITLTLPETERGASRTSP